MQDVRVEAGKALVVLAHCLLNQNTKPYRRARFPGAVNSILDVVSRKQLAVFQLPCPEIAFAGPHRWSQVIQQYDTPRYRAHCRQLVTATVDQLAHGLADPEYRIAVIGVDGSPSCGISHTGSSRSWQGYPGSVDFDGRYPVEQGMGIFVQELQAEIAGRGLRMPPIFGIGLDLYGLDLKAIGEEFERNVEHVFEMRE